MALDASVTNGLFALGGAMVAGGLTFATTVLNTRHERENSERQREWQVADQKEAHWQTLRAEREATYTRFLVTAGKTYGHAKSLAKSDGGAADQDVLTDLETVRMSVRMSATKPVRKAVGKHHKYLRHLVRDVAAGTPWPDNAEKKHRDHEKAVTDAMRAELFPETDATVEESEGDDDE